MEKKKGRQVTPEDTAARTCLKVLAALWIFLAAGMPVFSQCAPDQTALGHGESITYEVVYSWGPIWIRAGRVKFKTDLESYKETPCWHITSTGRTISSIEFLFKVRDVYETWIDTSDFHTLEFRRDIYESGYRLENSSWFDYPDGIVISHTKRNDDPIVLDTLRMKSCTFDMLSSCFFIRSMNLDTIREGMSFPVHIAIDDSVYTVFVRLLGKENAKDLAGIRYPCLKFSATMVEGTVFEKDEEAIVWLSDDPNRIPILIEAQLIVGSVKALLKESKGLKHPLSPLETPR